MDLKVEPKEVLDAYSTPIVQQTAFWSRVKERLGVGTKARRDCPQLGNPFLIV